MNMKEKSLSTLEYPKVLEMLASEAQTDLGRQRALELRPFETLAECERAQQQTADAAYLMGLYGSPSLGGISNVDDAVKRAEMGGTQGVRSTILKTRRAKRRRSTPGSPP